MEVGLGPNWDCSAKGKKVVIRNNYYTPAYLHNLQSLHTNLFSLSAQAFTGL
jgi:hypothetical protein